MFFKQRRPVFCRNCRWSKPDGHGPWSLRCLNPLVNRRDAWALAVGKEGSVGSCARLERELTFWHFPACGMAGKQYQPKSRE